MTGLLNRSEQNHCHLVGLSPARSSDFDVLAVNCISTLIVATAPQPWTGGPGPRPRQPLGARVPLRHFLSAESAAAAAGINTQLLVHPLRRQLRQLRFPGRKRRQAASLATSQAAKPFGCQNLRNFSACLARCLPCLQSLLLTAWAAVKSKLCPRALEALVFIVVMVNTPVCSNASSRLPHI